jgi:hypothetical protein
MEMQSQRRGARCNAREKEPCKRSTTPSSRTKIGIWFPFLLEVKFSSADGSIGPRAQWMERLAEYKARLVAKGFQ